MAYRGRLLSGAAVICTLFMMTGERTFSAPDQATEQKKADVADLTIDWREFEEALYEFTRSQLEAFGREHPDKSFYAFAICCNALSGEVLLSLNSEADFRNLCTNPIYVGYSKAGLEELRWSIGDWRYMHDVLSKNGKSRERLDAFVKMFAGKITALFERVRDADDEDEIFNKSDLLCQEFMRRSCLVALRLERDGAFDSIRKDPDFVVYAVDHDESDFAAWQRLIRIRVESDPPWNGKPWPNIGRHPLMAAALLAESVLYQQQGKTREAAHLLREGVARLPGVEGEAQYLVEGTDVRLPIPANSAWARAYLACITDIGWNNDELYHDLLNKAQQSDPELPEVYFLRAKRWTGGPVEAERLDHAVRELDRAIKLDPRVARYYGLRAEIRIRPYHPFPDEALRDFSKAHELDPTEQEWLMRRAELHVQSNRFSEAIEDYTKVFERWKSVVSWNARDALKGRAECYFQLKDFQAAVDDWTRLIDHYKDGDRWKECLQKRAVCYRAMNNEAAAAADEARAKQ